MSSPIRNRSLLLSVLIATLVLLGVMGACSKETARQMPTDSSSRQAVQFSEGRPQSASSRRVDGKGGAPEAAEMAANMDAAPPVAGVVGGSAGGAFTAAGQAAGSAQFVETLAPNMIIRTGQASVEVSSLDTAVARVRAIATALGGYIANTNLQSGEHEVRSATLEIKIPAARFDQAVSGLSAIGKVESVNVSAQDVGEEFVDITARVSNARRLEERLITLLASRTGKLQEVLSVERELARVREEIERYEGRLRYLRSRAAISTLAVMVHEPNPLLGPPPGQNVIVEALKQAWRHFVGLVAGLIESLGILIPLALILGGLWVVVRRWRPRVITREAPVRIIEKETRVEEEAPRT
jgi:uncharacterized protein DUF4349